MSNDKVKIGLPGDLIWPESRIEASASHVGGQPWYPAECGLPDSSSLKCGVCGERLRLILQAPLDSEDSSEQQSCVYLYVCVKEECGKELSCWRALRCHYSLPKPKIEQPLPAARSTAPQSNTVSTGGWGFDDEKPASAQGNQPATGGEFDFSDLSAALDAMNSNTNSSGPNKPTTAKTADAQKNESIQIIKEEDGPKPLPGFYLDMIDASEEGAAATRKHSNGSTTGNDKQSDSNHLRKLLEKYGEAEGVSIEAVLAGASGSAGGGGGGGGDAEHSEEEPATWEGEGYEKDEVLVVEGRKGVGRDFLRFMKKLQMFPDQCVRLSHNGTPLWPGEDLPKPTPCPLCNGPRVFELQLMTPTISALEESADWLEAEGVETGAVERTPASWEWATVAVYSCGKRCSGRGSGKYVEEEIFVAGED